MSDARSVADKVTKISEVVGLVCDELGVNQFMRAMAISYLQTKRDACLRVYDKAMKILEIK